MWTFWFQSAHVAASYEYVSAEEGKELRGGDGSVFSVPGCYPVDEEKTEGPAPGNS